MYCDHFGLKRAPFKITPDTRLFFPGGERGAVLDALIYAISRGEGIIKVVGEVGSGKTMLCRMLEEELPPRIEILYLANPTIAPIHILHAIAYELKLNVTAATPQLQVLTSVQHYLIGRHGDNRQVVVFVEEAQAMPIQTLEQIRLLSNLETQTDKLLQIVLFGQPELDAMIARPEIRQLKERITCSFQLPPFQRDDIRAYINARLYSCGYRAGELFSRPAVKAIQRHSCGLLRRINILADKALLASYVDSKPQVSARHVRQAVLDSEFVTSKRFAWLPVAGLAVLLAVLGGVALGAFGR